MKFIHVRNLKKFQDGYKDRRHSWAKIWIDLVQGNAEAELLDEVDFSRLIKLIVLETCLGRETSANESFLIRKGFDFKVKPLSETLKNLSHFIEIIDVTENEGNRNETVTESSPREEKRREEKSREEESRDTQTKFKKPTLEELSQALRSGGLEAALSNDEAQKFLDYYESVGWVVGRTRKPMKNWRGAISTWIKNRRAWESERKTSERPNPMNLNKKQLANAEALNDFLERKRSTRPGGVRQGDGVALLGVSIPELES